MTRLLWFGFAGKFIGISAQGFQWEIGSNKMSLLIDRGLCKSISFIWAGSPVAGCYEQTLRTNRFTLESHHRPFTSWFAKTACDQLVSKRLTVRQHCTTWNQNRFVHLTVADIHALFLSKYSVFNTYTQQIYTQQLLTTQFHPKSSLFWPIFASKYTTMCLTTCRTCSSACKKSEKINLMNSRPN